MIKQKIKHLKTLTTQKNIRFSNAMDYFLDRVSADDTFLNMSERVTDTMSLAFSEAILSVPSKHFKAKLLINSSIFVRVKPCQMLHGTGFLANSMHAVFYFFEDIQTGIAAVSGDKGRVEFFRLSMFMVDEDEKHADSVFVPAYTTSH